MPSIGETFKAAREARGISIPEAGQATRIKAVQLDALERDDYRGIAAPTYARGFIKLYAQFLHLDAAPLLEEYNTRHARPGTPPAPVSNAKPKGPVPPPSRIPPGYAGRKMTEAAAAKAAAEAAARPEPRPEPVSAPVVVPVPPLVETPPPYAPILPVAGVEPAPSPAPSTDSSPVTEEDEGLPLFAASREIVPAAPSRDFVPLVDVPAPDASPTFHPLVSDSAAPAGSEPVVLVERSRDGQVEVVESFRPNPSPVIPSDEQKDAYRRARLRQAIVVVAGVLIFVAVLWVIRRLINDAAPKASDLQGTSAQSAGLAELPPEPYLEGR